MRKTSCAFLFSVILVIGGCSNPNTQLVKIQKSNIDPKTGNLIVLWLQYPNDKEEPVIVTEFYAVYMDWYKDFKVFYLYDNIKKITYKTTNFDIFLEGLKALPEGSEIQRFDTCSRPRLYDIPRSKSEEMTSVFIDRKLRWAISKINGRDKEVICYCESNGFRYP